NLDQHWRKISELGEERRNTRILPVDACGQIRLSQFVQIFLVNESIARSLARQRYARHREVYPRRYEPRACGKVFACIAQAVDQCYSQSGAGAVATDCNLRRRNTLISQKSPCSQRVIVRCGKLMLRRESIRDSECSHSCGPARFGHQTTMALD